MLVGDGVSGVRGVAGLARVDRFITIRKVKPGNGIRPICMDRRPSFAGRFVGHEDEENVGGDRFEASCA